jgi:hypothetical protein
VEKLTSTSELHSTYERSASSDLCQGDLIRRTPEVEDVLKEIHQYYKDNTQYHHFVVLTQTCDLVRRDRGNCSARYITVAAVRPIADVIERFVDKQCATDLQRQLRFASEDKREKLRQALERLLNNNELAYFYFKEEPKLGLYTEYCAFLNLSIALKARIHYEKLLSARMLSLTESFQHKLGSLVGNMYSRVGTEDWPLERQRDRIDQLLEKMQQVSWLPKNRFRLIESALEQIEKPTAADLRNVVAEQGRKKGEQKEALMNALEAELTGLNVDPLVIGKFKRRIQSNPTWTSAFKA